MVDDARARAPAQRGKGRGGGSRAQESYLPTPVALPRSPTRQQRSDAHIRRRGGRRRRRRCRCLRHIVVRGHRVCAVGCSLEKKCGRPLSLSPVVLLVGAPCPPPLPPSPSAPLSGGSLQCRRPWHCRGLTTLRLASSCAPSPSSVPSTFAGQGAAGRPPRLGDRRMSYPPGTGVDVHPGRCRHSCIGHRPGVDQSGSGAHQECRVAFAPAARESLPACHRNSHRKSTIAPAALSWRAARGILTRRGPTSDSMGRPAGASSPHPRHGQRSAPRRGHTCTCHRRCSVPPPPQRANGGEQERPNSRWCILHTRVGHLPPPHHHRPCPAPPLR